MDDDGDSAFLPNSASRYQVFSSFGSSTLMKPTLMCSFSFRLGNCEVCNANESKYTCPRCEVKTCSLNCVKIHKTELECSGIRDKTLFKARDKFTNLDLLSGKANTLRNLQTLPASLTNDRSDYRLMEDISRSVIKYQRDKIKRSTRINTVFPYVRQIRWICVHET